MNFKGPLFAGSFSHTQGQLQGAGKSVNGRGKNSGEEKLRTFLTFLYTNFFLTRLDSFPPLVTVPGSPRNVAGYDCNVFRSKQQTKADETFQSSSYSV